METIAQHFSNSTFKHLITKHNKLLSLIQFSNLPNKNTVFTPATPDTINKGVFGQAGNVKNTPHNTFVDDNTISYIRSRMSQAMVASKESLFLLLDAKCSFSKQQLGYSINFPQDKILKLQKNFTIGTKNENIHYLPSSRTCWHSQIFCLYHGYVTWIFYLFY